jgi:hypothetical protein
VDLYGAACPGHVYTNTVDGTVIRTTDGVHFTPVGGAVLAPKLMPAIVAAGRAQMTGTAGSPGATTTAVRSAGASGTR